MYLIFNDIAGSEVLLILFVILIFFGSKSIPNIARTAGRTIRQVKDATAEIQDEIKKSTGDIKKDMNLQGLIADTEKDLRQPLDQMSDDLDQVLKHRPENVRAHVSRKVVMPPPGTEEVSANNLDQPASKEEDHSLGSDNTEKE